MRPYVLAEDSELRPKKVVIDSTCNTPTTYTDDPIDARMHEALFDEMDYEDYDEEEEPAVVTDEWMLPPLYTALKPREIAADVEAALGHAVPTTDYILRRAYGKARLTEKDIVFFSARSKGSGDYGSFSNFYKLRVPIVYNGRAYPHTEAAYQSEYRCKEESRDMFALPDGIFSSLQGAKYVYDTSDKAHRGMAYWGSNRPGMNDMSGIVAKMAVKKERAKKLGVELRRSCDEPRDIEEIGRIFKDVLYLKFSLNPELASMLIQTGNKILVEFDRLAGVQTRDPPLFSGILKDGKILGHNLMGRLLMHTRERLMRESGS
jgi:predicted NAD-dependent protein-ADP-ribosyltransferase YbiA (DUF1768 family)